MPSFLAHAERHVDIRIVPGTCLAVPEHTRRAGLRRRLAVERVADGIKNARLARARRTVNEKKRLRVEHGKVEADFFLIRPEGTDRKEFRLHFASLSSW